MVGLDGLAWSRMTATSTELAALVGDVEVSTEMCTTASGDARSGSAEALAAECHSALQRDVT